MTLEEFVNANDITIRTVYNRIKKGKLEAKRVLGKLLIRVS